MSGLGGLNKSPNGVVVGLVQLQLPVVDDAGASWRRRPQRICEMVGKARRNHGDAWTWWCSPSTRCTACRWTPRPRSCAARRPRGRARSSGACIEQPASGAASRSWSSTPHGNPYNSGLIIDDQGEHPALLPQAAPLGAGRALGAGQPGHPGVRRAERQQARADHLPRRHVPRDGARGRLQGRRDHPAHRRLHRADPPRLEDHQPGQRLPAT